MTRRDDRAFVVDIRDAATSVTSFAAGLSLEQFLDSDEKQSAIMLKIIVMGEATKRLSMEFRNRHAEIPWSGIAGMRDRLVHGYDQWDLEEVWRVATVEVPPLVAQLAHVLSATDR